MSITLYYHYKYIIIIIFIVLILSLCKLWLGACLKIGHTKIHCLIIILREPSSNPSNKQQYLGYIPCSNNSSSSQISDVSHDL